MKRILDKARAALHALYIAIGKASASLAYRMFERAERLDEKKGARE